MAALPIVIRVLGVVGTIAMLLVGGGMFVHHIEAVHEALHVLPSLLADLVAALVVGAAALGAVKLFGRFSAKSGA